MSGDSLSAFSHASDAAARITGLTWLMVTLAAAIVVSVVAIIGRAIVRNRHLDERAVDLSARGSGWIVWGGAVMPGLVVTAVFIASLNPMRRFSSPRPAVIVAVTGYQWWWQVDYTTAAGALAFRTANEIHIPVGKPVLIRLTSADVIHSFWVPQLQGKLDLIPGDTNELYLEARHPGVYTGACAEFCGLQHAHMLLRVAAEPEEVFAAWMAHQAEPGALPGDSLTAEGRRLFAQTACAECHTVRGTTSRADSAPDLSHVGGRATIAAGTLPNSLGHVEGWIANPQALKPGARMPTLRAFTGPQLRALAAYMMSLK